MPASLTRASVPSTDTTMSLPSYRTESERGTPAEGLGRPEMAP